MRKDPSGVAMLEVNGDELDAMIKTQDTAIVVFFCNALKFLKFKYGIYLYVRFQDL
jgi:hypothetical protein